MEGTKGVKLIMAKTKIVETKRIQTCYSVSIKEYCCDEFKRFLDIIADQSSELGIWANWNHYGRAIKGGIRLYLTNRHYVQRLHKPDRLCEHTFELKYCPFCGGQVSYWCNEKEIAKGE